MKINSILILNNHVNFKLNNNVTDSILCAVTFGSEIMEKINSKTEKS